MNACSALCGFCGRCSDRDGEAAREFQETCEHPTHWRGDRGECRLCEAEEPTITKQARQRQIQPALPKTGAA
jgi:hypothetical protein